MPTFQKMEKLNENKKDETIHLRKIPRLLRFLNAPNNHLSSLPHQDRPSPQSKLQSPAGFLQPPTASITLLTSSPTPFTSPTMARVKIPTVPLNPSPSKRRRLLLQESSTSESALKSNVAPMAVETPREREVLSFILILGIFTICIFYLVSTF